MNYAARVTWTERLCAYLLGGIELREKNRVRVNLFGHDVEGQGVPLLRCEELHSQELISAFVVGAIVRSLQSVLRKHVRHS